MELSEFVLFLITITLMTLLFFMYFYFRGKFILNEKSPDMDGIIAGSIIAGIGTGVILGFVLCCLLPTYYYITEQTADGYSKRYVINKAIKEQYSRLYIINQTDEKCYLTAIEYGDAVLKSDEQPIVTISPSEELEIKHKVDQWFEPFPEEVKSKSSGEIRRHILTGEQLLDAMN